MDSVKWNMKFYKTGIAHHLDALRAGVQVGNQFSLRIDYKYAGGKDMIPYERRLQIAELLEKNEVVSLDEFCKSLGGVSESTVRRDLKTMEKEPCCSDSAHGSARNRGSI